LDFVGLGTVFDFIKRTAFDLTVTDLASTNARFEGRLSMKDERGNRVQKNNRKIRYTKRGKVGRMEEGGRQGLRIEGLYLIPMVKIT
jgi:hypothetical protein